MDEFSRCVGTVEHRSVDCRIEFSRVLANDLTLISDFIHKTAGAFEQQLVDQILEETTKIGMTVPVPQGGSLADAFLEMVRKSDVSVGSDGKVSTPNIYLFGEGYQEQLQREIAERGPEFQETIRQAQELKEREALQREEKRMARYDQLV